eukprot:TRINITY_DN351_c0_g1_i2.p2 TRINITY_DN351_c0_g1~~TRINITY_DN351_c0_g1_i2.p2  ORF type:complete len:476 (-),score=97.12 TRINITY_DN351_c0_g1_i2:2388-3776(-)
MNDGATPLYVAARNGHTATVEVLLSKGPDPTLSWNGKTPLDIARSKNHAAIVDLLLDTTRLLLYVQRNVPSFTRLALSPTSTGLPADRAALVESVAAALRGNTHVTALALTGLGLSEADVGPLAEVLQTKQLAELDLSDNRLTGAVLFPALSGQAGLREVRVRNNPAVRLVPLSVVAALGALEAVDCTGCGVANVPYELVDRGGRRVVAYLREALRSSTRVFAAPVLLAGLGGVGKTALASAALPMQGVLGGQRARIDGRQRVLVVGEQQRIALAGATVAAEGETGIVVTPAGPVALIPQLWRRAPVRLACASGAAQRDWVCALRRASVAPEATHGIDVYTASATGAELRALGVCDCWIRSRGRDSNRRARDGGAADDAVRDAGDRGVAGLRTSGRRCRRRTWIWGALQAHWRGGCCVAGAAAIGGAAATTAVCSESSAVTAGGSEKRWASSGTNPPKFCAW